MVEVYDTQPPSSHGGWTRRRAVFVGIASSLTVALLIAVREVLLPFLLALIIAYVLTPLVAWGERRLRLPRSLSIVIAYVLVLGTIGISFTAMAPRIYEETVRFARDVPGMARGAADREGARLEKWVNAYRGKKEEPVIEERTVEPAFLVEKKGDDFEVSLGSGVTVIEERKGTWHIIPGTAPREGGFQIAELIREGTERLIKYVQLNALEFIKLGQTIIATFSRGVLILFMTLMVAGYVMHTRENIYDFFRSMAPRMHRPGFDFLMKRIDRGLSGVVRGQLVICVVNGMFSAIGFGLFGLKYWPVLALLAGVMSIVPIFGSILSTVPAVLVGLTQDFWTAFWVLLWILGIHQIEANLLNPKIIGVSAKLHPVLVVFSLLVGEHFFGLWGALLGVPVLSISQSVFNHFRFSLPDVEPDSLRVPELQTGATNPGE